MPRDNDLDSPSVSLRQRVLSPYTLLSLAIAIAFLFFLAVRFDLDWEQTWNNIKALDPLLYVLALLLYYLSFAFRGLRWRILSRSAGIEEIPDARTPSAWRYSQLIIIGWFVNSVAWLRLGDAYRAYALSDEARTGFSWSLGTIFGERVMDMIAVFVLIVVGALAFSLYGGLLRDGLRRRCCVRDGTRAHRGTRRDARIRPAIGAPTPRQAGACLPEIP